MKNLSTLISIFFLGFIAFGQQQRNVVLSLNANQEVLDVAYLTSSSNYIIVGDFTHINGQVRNHIAFLDLNGNLIPTPTSFPIISLDGVVNSIEILNNNIFIGGQFSTVNGVSSPGLRKITYNSTTSTFALDSWIPFTYCSMHDMCLAGTKLTLVGDFSEIYNGTGTMYLRNNIAEISTSSSSVLSSFSTAILNYSSTVFPARMTVKYLNTKYYISGTDLTYNGSGGYSMLRLSSGGVLEQTYPTNIYSYERAQNFDLFNDSILFVEKNYGIGLDLKVFNPTNNNPANGDVINVELVDQNQNILTSTNDGFGVLSNGENGFFVVSKIGTQFRLYNFDYTGIDEPYNNGQFYHKFDADTSFNLNAIDNFDPLNSKHIFLAGSKLFVSSSKLTGTPTQSSQGLIVYCLDPYKAKVFDNNYTAIPSIDPFGNVIYPPRIIDTVVCAGNIKGYAIPPVKYASNYLYQVTGNGIKYAFSTGLNVQPSSNSFIAVPSNGLIPYPGNAIKNQIWLMFDEAFTGGVLSVKPVCTCNTAVDYQYGEGTTLNLIKAPDPNIYVDSILEFTCIVDSLNLVVSSLTSNVSYSWNDQYGNANTNDSLLITMADLNGFTLPIYFKATVKENTGNQCAVTDSVLVDRNVITPELALVGNSNLWNCYTDSLSFMVQDTNSLAPESPLIYSWNSLNNLYSGSNPMVVHTVNDSIAFIAFYPSSGCSDTASFSLSYDLTPPAMATQTYGAGLQQVTDTINCQNDSLLVVLNPAANTTASWLWQSDTIPNSMWIDSYSMLNPDTTATQITLITFYALFQDTLNGCITSGPLLVVPFDLKKPFVSEFSGDSILSCSELSLNVIHDPVFGVQQSGWIENGNSNFSDTLLVTGPGNYVFEVVGQNQCIAYDSVAVIQTTDLEFVSASDTLVCPGSNFQVTAQAAGIGPFNYTWSNGSIGNTTTGIGGVDMFFTVSVSNTQGCSGMDTIHANITAPIVATFEAFSACGSGGFIQVDTVYGGAAIDMNSYLYAFDNGTFGTTYSFPVDSIGDYPFDIQDTLGCVYNFTTQITGVIQTPEVNFLVSTYNQTGDTVALVNISDFTGFDGYYWGFPSNLNVVYTSDSVAVFSSLDSGWYVITFTGFLLDTNNTTQLIDTCLFSYTKPVYFGNFQMNFLDSLPQNSVSNITLFPNPIAANLSASIILNFDLSGEQDYRILGLTTLGIPIPELSDQGIGSGTIQTIFNVPPLAAGTYYLHIVASHGAGIIKLVVE